jgi:hypothetical protein
MVADPAEDRRTKQDTDQARAKDRTEVARFETPGVHKARRREGDSTDVISIDESKEERPDK